MAQTSSNFNTSQTPWLNDIQNGGADPDKLKKDGNDFAKQLESEIEKKSGSGEDTTQLKKELDVVKNSVKSVDDHTYNQQSTQASWKNASNNTDGKSSEQMGLSSIAEETKAAANAKGGDTTSLRDNLGAFINQEKQAGHGDVAQAAQKELDDLKGGKFDALQKDNDDLNSKAKAAGISAPSSEAKPTAAGGTVASPGASRTATGNQSSSISSSFAGSSSGGDASLFSQVQSLMRRMSGGE